MVQTYELFFLKHHDVSAINIVRKIIGLKVYSKKDANLLLKLAEAYEYYPKKIRLIFTDHTSNKFWSCFPRGKVLNIHYGKIDTEGRKLKKEFASKSLAAKGFRQLIKEKIKKGYTLEGYFF